MTGRLFVRMVAATFGVASGLILATALLVSGEEAVGLWLGAVITAGCAVAALAYDEPAPARIVCPGCGGDMARLGVHLGTDVEGVDRYRCAGCGRPSMFIDTRVL